MLPPAQAGFHFKDNLLLNQHELDLRVTLKEIINDYPYVKNHKKFLNEDADKAGQQQQQPSDTIRIIAKDHPNN